MQALWGGGGGEESLGMRLMYSSIKYKHTRTMALCIIELPGNSQEIKRN